MMINDDVRLWPSVSQCGPLVCVACGCPPQDGVLYCNSLDYALSPTRMYCKECYPYESNID